MSDLFRGVSLKKGFGQPMLREGTRTDTQERMAVHHGYCFRYLVARVAAGNHPRPKRAFYEWLKIMWVKNLEWNDSSSSWAEESQTEAAPDLIFLFEGSNRLSPNSAATQIKQRFPQAHIVGCSTGTIINGGSVSDMGAAAIAVGFENTRLKVVTEIFEESTDIQELGRGLGLQLRESDLAAIFVLSDGLGVNGSTLVNGLSEGVGPGVDISGGLAGDGARFAHTFVHANGLSQSNLVAVIGFYGTAIRVAHGHASGWDVFGPHRKITRSVGNVLYELDGKPALDLYERYLGDEAKDLPASGLLYPLQVWPPEQSAHRVVRTILAIDREARSMTFAGDMPQGWEARLMRGNLDSLVESAASAASLAIAALRKTTATLKPALCLSVSCVGRRLLLGQRTHEEVEYVAEALGNEVAQIGFYSYGEIGPHPTSSLCALHNQTLTMTLIAEDTGPRE